LPKPRNNKNPSARKNQLRIIGGQWRGRKLTIAEVDGLRPTGDRIRETVFNWLIGAVADSRCLDLFAGSGALGLECLSRGAREVPFLEKHSGAAKQLQQNCQNLEAANSHVITSDTLSWLKAQRHPVIAYDLVFIDPPFDANLWDETITLIESRGLLNKDAFVYIESPRNTLIATPPQWQLQKEKQSGQVCYRLFQYLGSTT
jgi:16S rRNA (guanine966-N2)-methyltransferase